MKRFLFLLFGMVVIFTLFHSHVSAQTGCQGLYTEFTNPEKTAFSDISSLDICAEDTQLEGALEDGTDEDHFVFSFNESAKRTVRINAELINEDELIDAQDMLDIPYDDDDVLRVRLFSATRRQSDDFIKEQSIDPNSNVQILHEFQSGDFFIEVKSLSEPLVVSAENVPASYQSQYPNGLSVLPKYRVNVTFSSLTLDDSRVLVLLARNAANYGDSSFVDQRIACERVFGVDYDDCQNYPSTTDITLPDGISSVHNYFYESSNGAQTFGGKVVGWVDFDFSAFCTNASDIGEIANILLQGIIDDTGLPISDFRNFLIVVPTETEIVGGEPVSQSCIDQVLSDSPNGVNGVARKGIQDISTSHGKYESRISYTEVNAFISRSTPEHELGHTFGGDHADYYDCGNQTIDSALNCTVDEYGGRYYSTLGFSSDTVVQFQSAVSQQFDWLPENSGYDIDLADFQENETRSYEISGISEWPQGTYGESQFMKSLHITPISPRYIDVEGSYGSFDYYVEYRDESARCNDGTSRIGHRGGLVYLYNPDISHALLLDVDKNDQPCPGEIANSFSQLSPLSALGDVFEDLSNGLRISLADINPGSSITLEVTRLPVSFIPDFENDNFLREDAQSISNIYGIVSGNIYEEYDVDVFSLKKVDSGLSSIYIEKTDIIPDSMFDQMRFRVAFGKYDSDLEGDDRYVDIWSETYEWDSQNQEFIGGNSPEIEFEERGDYYVRFIGMNNFVGTYDFYIDSSINQEDLSDVSGNTDDNSNDTEPDEPTTNEIFPLPVSGLEEADFAGAQTISAPSYNVNTSNHTFAFTPTVRGLHTLYSTGSVAIDKVWLIDPLHNDQRILDYDEEQSETGQNFRVGNVLEIDRTYYLYVEYQAGASGAYSIEIIEPVDTSDSYGLNDDHSNRLPGDLTDQAYLWFDSRDATNMTSGQIKSGSLERQGDVDVFRVTLPIEHMSTSYKVSVTSDSPVSYIKESCGVVLDDSQATVYDVDGSYVHEFIYRAGATPLPEDFEFCVVMRGTAGANYTLEAGRVFPELGADDFGNTLQKSSLVTNANLSGHIQTDGDVDVFRYEASSSGNVMVELKTPDLSPGVSMTLLDQAGNEIADTFRESDGIAVASATAGQPLYVQVEGVVAGVTYHLSLGDEEYIERSTALPVNPVVVSDLGSVSGVYSIDVDGRPDKFYYQFSVAEAGDYELKINQPDEAKSFLTVYDENYQIIAGRESYAGFDHVVYPHLEGGKTYYVSLWRGHDINLVDLPFDFDLVKLQTPLVDESDRFDQPESLVAGQEVRGYFNNPYDVDVYSFLAPQDGHIQLIPQIPVGGDVTIYNKTTHQQIAAQFGSQGALAAAPGSLPVKTGEEIQVVSYVKNALGVEYGFQFNFSPGAPSSVPYPAQLPPDGYWPVNDGVPKLVDFATDYPVSIAGTYSRFTGWFYVDQLKSFDVSLVSGGRFVIVDDQKEYVAHGFEGMSQIQLDQGGYYIVLSSASGELENFDLRIEPTNVLPTLSFETSSLDQVFVGTPVSFNVSNSVDPDGNIVSYDWTLNGEVHPDFTGDVVNYGFDTIGDYSVEVTLTDDREAQVSDAVTFTVEERPDGDGTAALATELTTYTYTLYGHPRYNYYATSRELEYNGDIDFYTFVAPTSGRASIYTNGRTSTSGVLYDDTQTVMEESVHIAMHDNFFISADLEANRRYYIAVSGASDQDLGSYTVYVTNTGDDHDQSSYYSTPLSAGGSVAAQLTYSPSYGHDVDAFRIVPEQTGEYLLGTTGAGAVEYIFSQTPNAYTYTDGQTSQGQLQLQQSLQAGETYYLSLRVEIGYSTQYARNANVDVYMMQVKDDHPDLQAAATLLSENLSVTGQVDDTDDVDWFRVPRRYVYPGELYSVLYTGPSLAQLVIGTNTVALTSGQTQNINDSVGGYGTPVYVKVSGAVGSYSVQFIKESDDHGNAEAQATTITLGQTINGNIGTVGDVDVFKYTHSAYYCGYVRAQLLSGSNKAQSWYNNRVASSWAPSPSVYIFEYMCPGNVMYLRMQDTQNGTGPYSFRIY